MLQDQEQKFEEQCAQYLKQVADAIEMSANMVGNTHLKVIPPNCNHVITVLAEPKRDGRGGLPTGKIKVSVFSFVRRTWSQNSNEKGMPSIVKVADEINKHAQALKNQEDEWDKEEGIRKSCQAAIKLLNKQVNLEQIHAEVDYNKDGTYNLTFSNLCMDDVKLIIEHSFGTGKLTKALKEHETSPDK